MVLWILVDCVSFNEADYWNACTCLLRKRNAIIFRHCINVHHFFSRLLKAFSTDYENLLLNSFQTSLQYQLAHLFFVCLVLSYYCRVHHYLTGHFPGVTPPFWKLFKKKKLKIFFGFYFLLKFLFPFLFFHFFFVSISHLKFLSFIFFSLTLLFYFYFTFYFVYHPFPFPILLSFPIFFSLIFSLSNNVVMNYSTSNSLSLFLFSFS